MKSFKNIFVIVTLFTICSITAKRTGTQLTQQRPAVTTPAMTLPAVATKADSEIQAELTKIDRSLNAIKNISSKIINDTKITSSDRLEFIKKVEATYEVINEEIQNEYDTLQSKRNRLSQ